MPDSRTPDLGRLDFAFTSSSHPTRIGAIRRALVDLPLAVGPHLLAGRSRRAQHFAIRRWSAMVRTALKLRVTWSGYEAIDADRQYVVLALHESFVDVPLLAALPLDLRFTAREELFANENFGALLQSSHHVSVPETRSPSSIRLLVARLRAAAAAGDSIVVFPQGSLLGVEVAFQPGAWRLAQMLALPVLPVAIAGTHGVWGHPFDNEVHLARNVSVTVLPPIEPADWSADRARATERLLKKSAIETGLARRFDPRRDGWWDEYAFEIDPDFDGLRRQIEAHRDVDTPSLLIGEVRKKTLGK
jgi:1-acyl-sn-glycerol-3-phosphate acyltransferase